MAQLPPDGTWLMQQIGDEVLLFHRYTEEELLRFNPSDMDAVKRAQGDIDALTQLDAEQKGIAHFWSGYFYAYASGA